MISRIIQDSIFNTTLRHIVFAADIEGLNNVGFAGLVIKNFVPQLHQPPVKCKLGDVISAVSPQGIMFHGLVCHSMRPLGWQESPKRIIECLEKMDVPSDEPIAIVLLGGDHVGQLMGANIKENIRAIHAAHRNCFLYMVDQTGTSSIELNEVMALFKKP